MLCALQKHIERNYGQVRIVEVVIWREVNTEVMLPIFFVTLCAVTT